MLYKLLFNHSYKNSGETQLGSDGDAGADRKESRALASRTAASNRTSTTSIRTSSELPLPMEEPGKPREEK